ncbi:MAG TPA: SDR family NAD(P)-dependent oxidoreductase [Caulobacteraceae bacterium]|jgi:NAD(P)-dependent dehydrogenase (short-subunit alcohol dehydrogenase family)|nr:SDR family NAD(P)-dependent oxidoreductase [Caulobacteraceae bacterium]
MPKTPLNHPADRKAYIVTGPTSGLGRATSLAMAKHGTLVLVGRDSGKLNDMKKAIDRLGGHAVSVVCDMSDLASVRRAAAEIIALELPIVGLLNNAGVQNPCVMKNAAGWDMTFATNHVGPFALTEALMPHLEADANVVFIGSATEDPERGPAKRVGFRGSRYVSAEASARGEWKPGGSTRPGMDAYATSKQCNIVTAMALARENPQLHVNAIEPGIMFNTGLHANMNIFFVILTRYIVPLMAPFVKVLSTPKRAARVITKILIDTSGQTGVYYDEGGNPMLGSPLVRDIQFQEQVVRETRALLTTAPSTGA